MALKLIACDVDGTLLHHEDGQHIIFDENKKAIKRALDSGVIVTLATGRGYNTAHPVRDQLGISAPIICMNGAYVRDDETVYVSQPIDGSNFLDFYELSLEYDLSYYMMAEDRVFVVSNNFEKYKESMQTLGFEKSHYEGFSHIYSVSDLPMKYYDKVYKLVLQDVNSMISGNDDSKIPEFRKKAESHIESGILSSNLSMVSSWNDNVEIMSKYVDKGAGVDVVAKKYDIDRSQVMCIGDNENDIAMLDYAGYSVAMGNASSFVKSHARFVTDSTANFGVANIINRALNENW